MSEYRWHQILFSTVHLDPSDAPTECLELLAKPELRLWIRTRCNILLGGICQDVMEAKHCILEAEKQCEECLADCIEIDREETSVHQAIIRETLEELRPGERHFRMEMGECAGRDSEGGGGE